LVRKPDAPSDEEKRETPLSFARMRSLMERSPIPPAGAPAEVAGTDLSEALYRLAQQEVARILEAASGWKPFEVGTLRRVVLGMVNALAAGDDLLVQALDEGETYLDLPRHMVNVAIFAIKIGQGTDCREDELPKLGLAACLHDLGMVIVPRRILEKPESLSADEIALLRQHPERGFRILEALGPEYDWLAKVALQEHEREDGSGYPWGLKGDAIHEFARIVGIADVYEALTHTRPYQKRRVPYDVVKEIINAERRRFSDRVLKGLIRGLSTFPVGSLVRLNSLEVARIVATNPAFPLRPVVEVIQGPRGDRLPQPRRVDLATNTLLYITDTPSGKVPA
jgi:HD-GYP domain-containing protein (c-di-GMP phosphodiesterase class II)